MSKIQRTNWANSPWVLISQVDLETERHQCEEEGKDLSSVAGEFAALKELDLSVEENQQRVERLLEATQDLPQVAGYPYTEPSDLEGIFAERPAPVPLPALALDEATLYDKALGGWQGRAAGCLLGKPVEGKKSWDIEKYLKAQGRWPLDRYFSRTIDEAIAKETNILPNTWGVYEEDITRMVEDDDTNYTVTGLVLVKESGADFTPVNVARLWLGKIPFSHVCTAERVAYRNLINCIAPPVSATHHNVYREWIGAQIRADFFGYVNPGNPERAADMAWRDACISHVKNGIYGEMWVAAMLAAAYASDDMETVIRAGLAQVPAKCRLTAAIDHILDLRHAGKSYDEAIADVRARWDETNWHDWTHTISNAEIVALALLWGGMDYEKTICYSVMPGFDTDCNGATSGSVLGVMLGASRLPAKWITPLNDTLITGVAGYEKTSLSQMAKETVALMG